MEFVVGLFERYSHGDVSFARLGEESLMLIVDDTPAMDGVRLP